MLQEASASAGKLIGNLDVLWNTDVTWNQLSRVQSVGTSTASILKLISSKGGSHASGVALATLPVHRASATGTNNSSGKAKAHQYKLPIKVMHQTRRRILELV